MQAYNFTEITGENQMRNHRESKAVRKEIGITNQPGKSGKNKIPKLYFYNPVGFQTFWQGNSQIIYPW